MEGNSVREIKFRVWCKQTDEMHAVERMGFEEGELWYVEDENRETDPPYFIDRNDSVLMQYTGLKDKNGHEIYEGDILKVEHPVSEIMSGVFAVKIHHESMNYIVGEYNLGSGAYKFGEVIGNIYENPELLEETK